MNFSFSAMGIDQNSQEIKDAGALSGGFELIPNKTKLQFMMTDLEYKEEEGVPDNVKGRWFETKFTVVTEGQYKNRVIFGRYQIIAGSKHKDKPGQPVPYAIAKFNKLAEALGYPCAPDSPLDMKGNQSIFDATVIVKKGGKKPGTINDFYEDKNEIDDLKPAGGGMIASAPQMPRQPAPAPQQPAPQMQHQPAFSAPQAPQQPGFAAPQQPSAPGFIQPQNQ